MTKHECRMTKEVRVIKAEDSARVAVPFFVIRRF
jgi:hypothetical protein